MDGVRQCQGICCSECKVMKKVAAMLIMFLSKRKNKNDFECMYHSNYRIKLFVDQSFDRCFICWLLNVSAVFLVKYCLR